MQPGSDIVDGMEVTGRLRLELFDEHGQLKDVREVDNLVTSWGKIAIASVFINPPVYGVMAYMAVGTGATAPAVSDVLLVAEVGRVPLTGNSGVASGATIQYSATFPAGTGTGALQEAGIFPGASGGNTQNRSTFATINKLAGDTLNIVWTTTIG
jgi:hypothetical protein